MKLKNTDTTKYLTGGALVLAIASSVFAADKPAVSSTTATPPEQGALEKFFHGKIPDAFAKGKFNINVRARYEFVNQEGVPAVTDDSHAVTVRTRFGFTTAPVHGFQAMLEGENITALDYDNYNAAGSNGQGTRPAVADPKDTELNQAWVSYTYTNQFAGKVGRQRIVLDNHRFVGDVGWRQNQQTFDAASMELKPAKDLGLFYGYIWDVRRVFGDVSGLPATSAFRDFESSSHLLNASYSGWKYGKFTAYSYLLDLDLNNGTAAQFNNSCATYGLSFAGSAPVSDKVKLDYRLEGAYQTDYADSTLSYETEYYNVELGANVKPFVVGGGYEVLGSDVNTGAGGGRASFRTPLATLHAFNGWADVFLVTPAAGLRDIYGFAQVTLPAQIPLRFVYHKYDSDAGSADLGQEFDVVASKKFGKHWTAMLKYAYYDGVAAPAAFDLHKFWGQVEFNF